MTTALNGHDRAIDALHAIPPDLLHGDWIRAAIAFQAAGGDFATFDRWSASTPHYYNAQACCDLWKSIKPDQGINAATLYRMAEIHANLRMAADKPQRQAAPAAQAPSQATQAPRQAAPAPRQATQATQAPSEAAEPPRKASPGTTPTDAPTRPTGKRLGEVERAVLEFLAAHNVGIKKRDVVAHFESRYDKGPVYRAMKSLATAGAVHEAAGMVRAAQVAK